MHSFFQMCRIICFTSQVFANLVFLFPNNFLMYILYSYFPLTHRLFPVSLAIQCHSHPYPNLSLFTLSGSRRGRRRNGRTRRALSVRAWGCPRSLAAAASPWLRGRGTSLQTRPSLPEEALGCYCLFILEWRFFFLIFSIILSASVIYFNQRTNRSFLFLFYSFSLILFNFL